MSGQEVRECRARPTLAEGEHDNPFRSANGAQRRIPLGDAYFQITLKISFGFC